ncbi:MAG: DUF4922 domain-containing protein [Culturomica sp.]|jgi:hypothetical protein|nr:DUF4922 domain-containing protein [Culturomica sp.]
MQDIERLFREQLQTFPLAARHYRGVSAVAYKTVTFPGGRFVLQFNPERIRSTAAPTDPAIIAARPCFLCPANLPEGQRGIVYSPEYRIYVNPYPIFERHFTVPTATHQPQRIAGRFGDMLDIAAKYPACTVFYNGPNSGASAPDHFHFQLAPGGVLPVEEEADRMQTLADDRHGRIGTLPDYLRKVLFLHSGEKTWLVSLFDSLLETLGRFIPSDPEPMLNLIVWRRNGYWTAAVFPRKQLRPRQFYAEGAEQILFSPGSVDFGGLLVTPRREDFERLDLALLSELFAQLTVGDQEWEGLCSEMSL